MKRRAIDAIVSPYVPCLLQELAHPFRLSNSLSDTISAPEVFMKTSDELHHFRNRFRTTPGRGSVSLNWLSTTIDDAKSEGDGLADADGA